MDKTIDDLLAAEAVTADDLFVVQQNSTAKKVSGDALRRYLGAGGTDISLGLTAATVGQTVKVKAIDADGKPTEWEAVEMAGGDNTFKKVVEMTTLEDAAVISIGTDKNGNSLSMSEFYVAITTSRNNAATENNIFGCNVLPDTVPAYIRAFSAIKNLRFFQDVYCHVMHYKVVGGMIFSEYVGRKRTASSLDVAEYLDNLYRIGIIPASNPDEATSGFLSSSSADKGVSKTDSSGKMYCITFDVSNAECIFGAGTRVEVWAK